VTTAANDVIRKHDRMPVMLEDDDLMAWLEPGPVPTAILKPYPAERMTAWRVMDEARNSRIPDHPGMVEPIAE
jgi:putative SOS response-associated peptidase YedK